jgi:murein DD-endopeptidase MepM/ murein hydrolase activator NlpD
MTYGSRKPRLLLGATGALAAACAAVILAGPAPAQDLQERLSETEQKLDRVQEKKGVLTTEISAFTERISTLEGQVADLRNKEAQVAEALAAKEAELEAAQAQLVILRDRLKRAISILEARLVAIYKTGEPDLLTVVLDSEGYGDLVERAEYMERLEEQDSSIVERVRGLRDQMRQTVDTVKAARDEIAIRKQELEQTRAELESRTAELAAARAEEREALSVLNEHEEELEGDLSEISKQIQEQLGSMGDSTLPAGPIRGGSSGFIWPVNGPVTSGFGWRWGRMHEGIDIGVPSGTPIRAVKSGSIVLASAYGGYGNYTCISHGGGLSSCYAHQSSFARTSGSISQGEILGYVGCTGHCFGDHLHFEVRINGEAVDPLGYL